MIQEKIDSTVNGCEYYRINYSVCENDFFYLSMPMRKTSFHVNTLSKCFEVLVVRKQEGLTVNA